MIIDFSERSRIDNGQLAGLLSADLAAASVSAALVSPFVVAIDRSVVENVATGSPIIKNIRRHASDMLSQPRSLLRRPVLVMWTLYTATYSMVNLTDTVATRFLGNLDKAVVGALISFNTFIINTPLSVWKDVRFAQFFGSTSSALSGAMGKTAISQSPVTQRSVPDSASSVQAGSRVGLRSMAPPKVCAAFLLRDIITVFGTFAIAPRVSSLVPDTIWTRTSGSKSTVSQLVVPAMTQIVATPLHLLALDLYARPQSTLARTDATKGHLFVQESPEVMFRDRVRVISEKWPAVTLMRGARLIPAFGIGVVCNMQTREMLHPLMDRNVK